MRGDVAAGLLRRARSLATSKVSAEAMLSWLAAAATLRDEHGAARPELEELLAASRKVFDGKLGPRAARLFFDLAAVSGAALKGGPRMPMRRVPYWQKEAHPLAASSPRRLCRAGPTSSSSGPG